jgi:regulator of replication initiation timing
MWTCINDIICDLQGLVKTAKYRKRCFDQIQGISEDNKELTTEVDRLCKQLETVEKNQAELESQRLNVVLQLGQKERERAGNSS